MAAAEAPLGPVKIPTMEVPPPPQLLRRIEAIPAVAPLLARLSAEPPVYLVGGAVRDLLRDTEPLDLDFVVEGDAVALARGLSGQIRAHGRFGTCTVSLDGATYDFASSRRERYARPGALPDVEPAPLPDDLRRRDFTVNALAVGLVGSRAGDLFAVDRALEDLDGGALRVMHAHSFIDDPTRLLRLARYAGRLGFEPEPQTEALARDAIGDGALTTVSGDRIGNELRLLAREPTPLAALAWLRRLGIDEAIAAGFGLADSRMAHVALEVLGSRGRRDLLVLGSAARGLDVGARARLLENLAFPAADRGVITAVASGADALAARLAQARTPAQIAEAVAAAPPEAVAAAGALGPREQARQWLGRLRDVRLQINGDDLLAAGVPRGPAVGRGLRAALAAKLDGAAPDRAAELEQALAAARGG
jgi:tRNA nucleotidyltransferase (CCA-adding enzyme)